MGDTKQKEIGPPPKISFKQFLWNSETSQCLGRTGSSWGECLEFYQKLRFQIFLENLWKIDNFRNRLVFFFFRSSRWCERKRQLLTLLLLRPWGNFFRSFFLMVFPKFMILRFPRFCGKVEKWKMKKLSYQQNDSSYVTGLGCVLYHHSKVYRKCSLL